MDEHPNRSQASRKHECDAPVGESRLPSMLSDCNTWFAARCGTAKWKCCPVMEVLLFKKTVSRSHTRAATHTTHSTPIPDVDVQHRIVTSALGHRFEQGNNASNLQVVVLQLEGLYDVGSAHSCGTFDVVSPAVLANRTQRTRTHTVQMLDPKSLSLSVCCGPG